MEDSYGKEKRFHFVAAALTRNAPRTVLDVGCGTGTQLTARLAAAYPAVTFVAIDSDRRSIAHAKAAHRLPNLTFEVGSDPPGAERFDVIIASEVLEHVADPVAFLRRLRRHLSDAGVLIL